MRKIILTAAALLVSVSAHAAQDIAIGTELGTSLDAVKAKLVEMGYDVRKGEMEDGRIEVYVVVGKQMGEVYVDAATGKIAKISMQ